MPSAFEIELQTIHRHIRESEEMVAEQTELLAKSAVEHLPLHSVRETLQLYQCEVLMHKDCLARHQLEQINGEIEHPLYERRFFG